MAVVFVGDFAFKDVGFADELGGEAAVGVVVDVAGGVHLLQLAVGHNRHAGGHGHGFFLVVRYHDAGYAHFFQRVHQFELGLLAQFFVERAQRFVQKQQFGAFGQRASECDALLLAAGELVRLAFGVFGHLHQAQYFVDAFADFGGGDFVLFQAEGDVLLHRHVREEGVALEHHIDGAVVGGEGGDVLAVEDDAALRGRFHAGQHPQQGGFARAGAAEQGEDFVLFDVEADVVDGEVFTEFFHQPSDLQIGLGGGFCGHLQCSKETRYRLKRNSKG